MDRPLFPRSIDRGESGRLDQLGELAQAALLSEEARWQRRVSLLTLGFSLALALQWGCNTAPVQSSPSPTPLPKVSPSQLPVATPSVYPVRNPVRDQRPYPSEVYGLPRERSTPIFRAPAQPKPNPQDPRR